MHGGVYIHVPFCRKKCPYCDFTSTVHTVSLEAAFVEAISREIQEKKRFLNSHPFVPKTLYMGGGTPSVLSLASIERILSESLRVFFPREDPEEVTVECNPESASLALFRHLRGIGVNRVSIGVQDLTKKGLHALRRLHSVKEAILAVESAKRAGFSNISIDLIYGWPGQDQRDLFETLEVVSTLPVMHVSFYELAIEKGTMFHELFETGTLDLPPEAVVLGFMDMIEDTLRARGLYQYEVSNFARPGSRCIHNVFYWENRPYLGLGPSAASYYPPRRWMNTKDIKLYLDSSREDFIPLEYEEALDQEGVFRETVVMGLRLIKGVSVKGLEKRFSINLLDYYGDIIWDLASYGFVDVDKGSLRLTKKGRRVLNRVLSFLV